jgi:hypothetical protein
MRHVAESRLPQSARIPRPGYAIYVIAFDPKWTFKVRLSTKFVRDGVMSRVRRRLFVIHATKALGITIPPSVLLGADRVIE